ncbi:MAG TPA: sugar ABC transporter permease [Phycisphaerales bacterium]|nr:sugar ABC transporter permease [Phycisphaerales bacterium]
MTGRDEGSTGRWKHARAGLLWTSPWLIGGTVFILLPMALSLYFSLTDFSLLEPPVWIGGENYRQLVEDPRFWLSVRNTAVFAAVFIPLATALSLALAVSLSGSLRVGRFVQACVFIPTLVPMVATAVVFSWLFNSEYGLVNAVLRWIGAVAMNSGIISRTAEHAAWFEGPSWLTERAWAVPALVVLSLWSIGQQVVVYIAAVNEVPRELHEAARLDGMSVVGRFLRVTLPMISPVVLFNVVVLTINTLQVFAQPYILFRTKDGQNDAGLFYTMYLYDNAFVYQKMGYASAMAWIQLVVVLALTGVMWWASKKFVHYRAA